MDKPRSNTIFIIISLLFSIEVNAKFDFQKRNKDIHTKEIIENRYQLSEIIPRRFGKRDLYHLDPCALYGTCSFNKNLMYPNCKCDNICHIYHDCCLDADKNTVITNKTRLHLNMVNYMTCLIQKDANQIVSSYYLGYQIVLKCPPDFKNLTIKAFCELDKEMVLPVTSIITNITYLNVFCAFCHNEEVFIPWTMYFSGRYCGINNEKQIQLVNEKTNFKLFQEMLLPSCKPIFEPSSDLSISPRVCTDIPRDISPVDHRCNAYTNPIIKTCERLYCFSAHNNYFCLDDKNVTFTCKDPTTNIKHFRLKPLTIVFRFGIQKRNNYEKGCEDKALDLKSGLCISDFDNQTQTDEKVTLRNAIVGAIYGLTVANNTDTETILRFLLSFSIKCLRLSNALMEKTYLHVFDYCEPNQELINTYCAVTLLIQITIEEEISVKLYNLFENTIRSLLWSYKETLENGSNVERIYYRNISLNDNSILDRPVYKTIFRFRNLKEEEYVMEKDLFIVENETLIEKVKRLNNVCNLSATVDKDGKIVNLTTVLLDDVDNETTLDISKKHLKDAENTSKTDKSKGDNSKTQTKGQIALIKEDSITEIIVTYSTMGLSIFSLVFTLFLIKCINIELNTSCYMVINTIVVLLTAHLLFIFGSGLIDYSIPCYIVGFLSLYTWLSFFLWINIFVLYITLKIKSVWEFLGPKKSGSKMVEDTFAKSNFIVGYCVPFVVVIPSVIIDVFQVKNIQIINKERECFPNTYPSNIVVFVAPVLCSILFNVICLCISALHIYRLRNVKLHSSIHTTKSYITMFLKLCSISGVSWVIGFFAQVYRVSLLDYIFITFSGLHGFIFSLCFISSKQVRDAFRKQFQKKQDKVYVDYIEESESNAPNSNRDIMNANEESYEMDSYSVSKHLRIITSDQLNVHSVNKIHTTTQVCENVIIEQNKNQTSELRQNKDNSVRDEMSDREDSNIDNDNRYIKSDGGAPLNENHNKDSESKNMSLCLDKNDLHVIHCDKDLIITNHTDEVSESKIGSLCLEKNDAHDKDLISASVTDKVSESKNGSLCLEKNDAHDKDLISASVTDEVSESKIGSLSLEKNDAHDKDLISASVTDEVSESKNGSMCLDKDDLHVIHCDKELISANIADEMPENKDMSLCLEKNDSHEIHYDKDLLGVTCVNAEIGKNISIQQKMFSKTEFDIDPITTKATVQSISNEEKLLALRGSIKYQQYTFTEECSGKRKHVVSVPEVNNDKLSESLHRKHLNKRLAQNINKTETQEQDISISFLNPETDYQQQCMFKPDCDSDEDEQINVLENNISKRDLARATKAEQVVEHKVYVHDLGQF